MNGLSGGRLERGEGRETGLPKERQLPKDRQGKFFLKTAEGSVFITKISKYF